MFLNQPDPQTVNFSRTRHLNRGDMEVTVTMGPYSCNTLIGRLFKPRLLRAEWEFDPEEGFEWLVNGGYGTSLRAAQIEVRDRVRRHYRDGDHAG